MQRHTLPQAQDTENQTPGNTALHCIAASVLGHFIPNVNTLLAHSQYCFHSSRGTSKHLVTLESAGYTRMLQREGGLSEHAVCSHLMAWHPVNEISRGCPRQTHYLLKLVNILRCLVKGIVKHTV